MGFCWLTGTDAGSIRGERQGETAKYSKEQTPVSRFLGHEGETFFVSLHIGIFFFFLGLPTYREIPEFFLRK